MLLSVSKLSRLPHFAPLRGSSTVRIVVTSSVTITEPQDSITVPEFIDPVFVKTRPKRSFSMTENEQFGLVIAKTGSIISGTKDEICVFLCSVLTPSKFKSPQASPGGA
jgi:hypothetical protein